MTTQLLDVNGKPLMIRRGTSPTHRFAITDQDTGLPKNLAGATEVTLAIAFDRGATSRDLQLTLGSGISHDGAGGNVDAAFTAAQTEALPVGTRWAELWITDGGGRRDLVAEGPCEIHDTLVNL